METTKLSVIVINYNTPQMTERAIRVLREGEPELELEIILIDNNSTQKLAPAVISALSVIYIENQENLGFARAVNQGLKFANGKFILLLNSDVLIMPGAISRLLTTISAKPEIGIVGPKMIYPDGKAQVSFGYFPNVIREFVRLSTLYKIIPYGTLAQNNRFNHRLFEQGGEVDWLSGGCLLLDKKVIEKIGSLDSYYFFGVEDIDFCFRAAQAGFKVSYQPQAVVTHYHGLSSGGPRTISKMEMERDNLDYFMKKNYPNKYLSRWLIKIMHRVKIWLVNKIDKIKN